jgi:hypothetical protein
MEGGRAGGREGREGRTGRVEGWEEEEEGRRMEEVGVVEDRMVEAVEGVVRRCIHSSSPLTRPLTVQLHSLQLSSSCTLFTVALHCVHSGAKWLNAHGTERGGGRMRWDCRRGASGDAAFTLNGETVLRCETFLTVRGSKVDLERIAMS